MTLDVPPWAATVAAELPYPPAFVTEALHDLIVRARPATIAAAA